MTLATASNSDAIIIEQKYVCFHRGVSFKNPQKKHSGPHGKLE